MYFNKYDLAISQNMIFIQAIFFKLIGLSPWTISVPEKFRDKSGSSNDKNYKCTLSYVGMLYNVIIFVVGVSLILYAKINDKLQEMQEDSLVTSSVMILIYCFIALVFCVLILIYVIKQNSMINVINRLISIDGKLLKYACYSIKNYKTIFVVFSVNFVMSIYDVMSEVYTYSLLTAFVHDLPVLINSWIIIQYTIILDVIIKRFEMINLAVSKLRISNYTSSASQLKSVINLSLRRELVLYDIDNLKHAYMEMCEISQDVGDFFGIFILIITIYSGILIISVLYFIFVQFINDPKFDIMAHLNDIIWLIWILSEFTLLTTYVNRTEKESQKTAGVINVIMDQCTGDEELKQKLFLFSHALLHRTVEFNVCDLIPLNRTLLQNIAGTVVTYLIILLQFRSSATSN